MLARSCVRWTLSLLLLAILRPVLAEEVMPPTAERLAKREEFRQDRFGIFIHWGIYSVLGHGEWVMNQEKITVDKYEPVAKEFNPVKFNADEWCRLFKDAGAKYITITSKHHDGFAMWDSKVSDWDIVDRTPYKKDVLKQLAEACKKHGLKLYFYHSHLDWHHPEYFPHSRTGHDTGRAESGDISKYLDYMDAQLAELLGGEYGEVAGIWFDGWWDQQTPDEKDDPQNTLIDWRLAKTYNLIHGLQPKCLIGNNHHVKTFDGEDFQMFERDLPGEVTTFWNKDAKIGQLPLETCDTLNGNWGYDSRDQKFKSVREIVHYLVKAAGRDANLLLNIGPKSDGTIDDISAERLRGMGEWVAKFEPTFRGTRGGPVAPQKWGVTTQTKDATYVHVLDSSAADGDGALELIGCAELAEKSWTNFATKAPVKIEVRDGRLFVMLSPEDREAIDCVMVVK